MNVLVAILFSLAAAFILAKFILSRRANARAAATSQAFGRIRGFLDLINQNFLAAGENGYAPCFEGGKLSDGSEYFRIHGEIAGRFGFDCMEIVSGEATSYRFLFIVEAEGHGFRGEARGNHPLTDDFAAIFGKYRRFHDEMRTSFQESRAKGGPHSSVLDVRKLRGEHLS